MSSILRVAYSKSSFPAVSTSCDKFPTLMPSTRCSHPGQMVEILYLLAKQMNMRIEAIPLQEDHLNASICKGLDMMERGEVDTLALGFQFSEERNEKFAFTTPIYKIQSRMLMRKHDNVYSGIGGFLNTYQVQTWVIILFALVLQCLLAVIIRKTEIRMKLIKRMSVVECVWQTVSLQLMKAEKMTFASKAGKVSIMVFSLIQCVILLGIFSSSVLSNILYANSYPPINSLDLLIGRIARKENYLISSTPNNWFYQKVRISTVFPYAELREALQKNPLRTSPSTAYTLKTVQKGKAIVYAQDDDPTIFRSLEYCDIVSMHNGLPKTDTHLLLKKDSPLLEKFNRVIDENLVHIMRICRKYIAFKDRLKKCNKRPGYKPLAIYPYFGTAIVCALLFALSALIFMSEKLVLWWSVKRKMTKFCSSFCV